MKKNLEVTVVLRREKAEKSVVRKGDKLW